jgi:hypothetical protein
MGGVKIMFFSLFQKQLKNKGEDIFSFKRRVSNFWVLRQVYLFI